MPTTNDAVEAQRRLAISGKVEFARLASLLLLAIGRTMARRRASHTNKFDTSKTPIIHAKTNKMADIVNYRIRLDMFEGPLDLLLYLIKEEELNIFDIPILRITEQYLEYLNLMEMLDLEVAGEFLVMAATLIQIKSRMLLPPDPDGLETQEEDPRAELVRRLLEYKAFKEAAEKLKGYESKQSGIFPRFGIEPEYENESDLFSEVSLFDLLNAFNKVLKGLEPHAAHEVVKDEFTVAEKIHEILHELVRHRVIRFSHLFRKAKNKIEAITIFLAMLEMTRLKEILLHQDKQFGEIEISKNIQAIEPKTPAEEPKTDTQGAS